MRNSDRWKPTKFELTNDGLRPSRNPAYVGTGSRFIASIIAAHYARCIGAHAAGRLLDLGCGFVPLYGVYRDLVESNICVDWPNTLHTSPHLDAIVNLNERLPFRDESFDTVLLTDVLEHIAEPLQLMQEIGRVLRVDGKVIVGVPFMYLLHEVPHDYYRYTEFALRRFCQLSGLNALECTPYGGLPEVLMDLTSKGIEILPELAARCLRPPLALAPWLVATKPFRKVSEWTSHSIPLGYVLVGQKLFSRA